MTIKWSAPASNGGFAIQSYNLYVNNALSQTLDPAVFEFQMTGLTLGLTYKLQVSASNEIGEGSLSDANSILFANVPSTPASLTLTSTSTPDITATWTAPSSVNGDAVKGYKLFIDDGMGGPFSLVFDGSKYSNIYTFKITSQYVQCGVLYNVQVTAINTAGESAPTPKSIRAG